MIDRLPTQLASRWGDNFRACDFERLEHVRELDSTKSADEGIFALILP
jgi:hypothetical protein